MLGGGLRVLTIGKRKLVQTVPCELDNDHAAVLTAAQERGWVTRSQLASTLGWNDIRIEKVLAVRASINTGNFICSHCACATAVLARGHDVGR